MGDPCCGLVAVETGPHGGLWLGHGRLRIG
jgi:hypothetical protein